MSIIILAIFYYGLCLFLFSSLVGSTLETSLSTGSSTTPGQNVPSSSEEKKNLNFE